MIEIDVRDTGCGIDPEQLDRVFDRFYRVGGRGDDGFGLGLAIVREAAARAAAAPSTSSLSPAQGTAARLRLPACETMRMTLRR